MAAGRQWEVVEIYQDRISGTKAGSVRKGFTAMTENARRGAFDVLLVFDISRLTREGSFAAFDYVRQLDKYGVRVASHLNSYLDPASPFYGTMLAMAADMAALERNIMAERIIAGIARKRKGTDGAWGRHKVVFDRARVIALREDGKSVRQICAEMGLSVGTVQRTIQAHKGAANA